MLSKLIERHIPVDISSMRSSDFLAAQERFELKKLEHVRKGHGWKAVERCPVCDATEYEPELEKHGVPLVRCANCNVRFHSKIPADLNDVYQAADYTVYTKEASDDHFNYRRERFGRERIRLLEEHCGDLADKSLLDVGCGDGYFLSVAKEVCGRCVGSEFSAHLREVARNNTGLTIYSEPVDILPEQGFDIITAFDVIEHIAQPVPFMRAATDLLAPAGYILLYTPNFDSFSVRVMRERSSIVDGTEHVVLFNRTSLHKLGHRAGLEMVHTETRGLDIHSIIAYQSHLGEEPNPFLEQWLEELQAMIDTAHCADYLRVIYRKTTG